MKTFTGKDFEEIQTEHQNILEFKKKNGQQALIDAIYHGAFYQVAFDYIHPTDEIRNLHDFQPIFGAFCYAYV